MTKCYHHAVSRGLPASSAGSKTYLSLIGLSEKLAEFAKKEDGRVDTRKCWPVFIPCTALL